ncbi:MAG: hypothetical protein ACM3SY_06745 [Candidatus Omnitrophota bacterium]
MGWLPWVSDGQTAGTTGQGRRMEAVEIKLVILPKYAVQYRAHVANLGWLPWVSDGQTAGTTGQSRQMEAVEIKLDPKLAPMKVQYRAHVANLGWLPWVSDGQTAGTTGQGRRMEAVEIKLVNPPAGYAIQYRAHVADLGWLPWMSDGQTAGTTGQSRRMEAVEIKLTKAGGCGTPPYSPNYWNDQNGIQYNNNCYNYANNKRTDTFAQPGLGGGDMYHSIDCAEVTRGAITDGLEKTTATAVPTGGKTKIALVIWPPEIDFHWYRQDSNGKWSHKPGGTMATNRDNSGNIIANPETANRGPYTIFCGYFLTCSDVNQGQGHANIK